MKKPIITLSIALSVLGGVYGSVKPAQAQMPVDVSQNHWAYQVLQKLIQKYQLKIGYPDGTFRGEQTMSRYEIMALFAQVLDKLSGVEIEVEERRELNSISDSFGPSALEPIQDQVDVLEFNFERMTDKFNGLLRDLPFQLSGGVGLRYEVVSSDFNTFATNMPQASARLNILSRRSRKNPWSYGGRLTVGNTRFIGQTWWKLGDFYSKIPFSLDRFFVGYKPWEFLEITAGKYANNFSNSEIFYDMDINLTGAKQTLKWNDTPFWLKKATLEFGESVISMDNTFGNAAMLSGKGNLSFNLTDWLSWDLSGAYHHYLGAENILKANDVAKEKSQPARFVGMQQRNTPVADGSPAGAGNFQIANGFTALNFNFNKDFPIKIFGDVLYNLAQPATGLGYQISAKIGRSRHVGNFALGYNYKFLQKDASISYFVEDQLKGTDVMAHEGVFSVKIAPQTTLQLTAQNSVQLTAGSTPVWTIRSAILQRF